MTGYDSSNDKSPEAITMLVLAAFSTSYNLPVYLLYNITFRRAWLRMLRCQAVNDSDTPTVGVTGRVRTAGDGGNAADGGQLVRRQVTSGREPQDDNKLEPSTSQDHPRPPAVSSKHQSNTEQLDASDASVIVHRY